MDTKEITNTIASYFKGQPVEKAWLFGCYSIGEQRPDSDVDIIVSLDNDAHVGLFKLNDFVHTRKFLQKQENIRVWTNLLGN